MKFVEILLDHPLLRVALQESPEMEVEWVRNAPPSEEWEMLFWASGGDFDAFDSGLENDPTVTVIRSIDVGMQRLYQVEIVGPGAETDLYPVVVELGGMVISATVTPEGWLCEFGFPDQASVQTYFETVEEYQIEFDIRRIYDLQQDEPEPDYDLTAAQRETLVTARQAGYFDIPREISLQELGDEFDTSDQAASERLRRGMKKLVDNTLPTGQHDEEALEEYVRTDMLEED